MIKPAIKPSERIKARIVNAPPPMPANRFEDLERLSWALRTLLTDVKQWTAFAQMMVGVDVLELVSTLRGEQGVMRDVLRECRTFLIETLEDQKLSDECSDQVILLKGSIEKIIHTMAPSTALMRPAA